jgi:hypothetical protein
MKKILFLVCMTALTSVFVSCSKDDDDNEDPKPGETKETYIDASSSTTWNYYSFAEDKVVGSAIESAENNAIWAARKDWDIAIQRYHIRTNSGEFTTAGAKAGVYTFDETTTFASVLKVPVDAEFVEDKTVSYQSMGGMVTTTQSEAIVVAMKQQWNEQQQRWETIMPPIYLQMPVYIFRTADGNNYYKVQFTQYQNEESAAGHVKFNLSKISL